IRRLEHPQRLFLHRARRGLDQLLGLRQVVTLTAEHALFAQSRLPVDFTRIFGHASFTCTQNIGSTLVSTIMPSMQSAQFYQSPPTRNFRLFALSGVPSTL